MPVLSEDEARAPYYEGYIKQQLLSGAALAALADQDVRLLEALKASGWDSSLPLGRMPDGELLSFSAATYSALKCYEKNLAWLINENRRCLLERDGYLRRPIDIALEDLPEGLAEYPEEVKKHESTIKMLERDGKPVESEAIEEVAQFACRKFGGGSILRIHRVNGKEPGKPWENFDGYIAKLQSLENSLSDKKKDAGESSEPAEPARLLIQWKLADDNSLHFVVTKKTEGDWGSGGVKGELRNKHGYWIAENVNFWDS